MRPTRILAALLAAAALSGCAEPTRTTELPPVTDAAGESTAPAGTPADRDDRGSATDSTGPTTTLIARARGDLPVHVAPDGPVSHELPATTGFGSTTTLLVLDAAPPADSWIEVALPVRPNGTSGFVRVTDVTLERTTLEVFVDTAARELRVRDGDTEILAAPTAVGEPANPTPTGRFWLTDKVANEDPDGPYGAYALGLSARSETLTEFAGGDGQVAIHGTDQPSSIGRAVSHGCLRVADEVVEQLLELLPLGAPVTIS